jgi:hypothetical protein
MPIPFSTSGTIDAAGESVAIDYRFEVPNTRRFNGAAGVQIVGTFVGTLNVEVTRDGETYGPIQALNEATGMLNTAMTAAGLYRAVLAGVRALRVKAAAWTSGEAAITLMAVEG